MTINDFVEKFKGTHVYVSMGENTAKRVFIDYDGIIDFEFSHGEEVSIGLLDEINRDVGVDDFREKGLHVSVVDRDGFGDWDLYTNAEEAAKASY